MSTIDEGTIGSFLSDLENREAKLLTWGFVDGGFSTDEIHGLAADYMDTSGISGAAEDLIEEMVARRLLFEFGSDGRRVWRTRMAEGVRLFARLRQIFPHTDWAFSPTLVADFRLAVSSRTYPRRHISPTATLEYLGQSIGLSASRQEALAALLDRGSFLLSHFQVRATDRMLRDLSGRRNRGMIVCAGTGTGKTLAFYLPALTHVAETVERGSYWTKVLAIYPRNELLRDQFSETYQEVRRLDETLLARGKRKISIGAFFGPTPRDSTSAQLRSRNWSFQRAAGGYCCPYLCCPGCKGVLVWKDDDVVNGRERLHCVDEACGAIVQDNEVVLTRSRMAQNPPDLLFTTTEMLNRQMGDSRYGHVFGINVRTPPQIMLLDEIHTYAGTHGAQVAYLLRRWRHAAGGRVHFTGLSATLDDAASFFGQLVGLNPTQVEEITPGSDLEQEGMEYQLLLRGDPVSATSLLSTSIQTAMLLSRILDSKGASPSCGLYGRRVFVFTDDLDVTNRLYHSLLDAEGLNSRGRPIAGRRPLASLRSSTESAHAQRLAEGQSWFLCEEIGHHLAESLRIGRTSSQDTGVDPGRNVIVATSSLEVGYNDPDVGAVMQHKAPMDMASFLQRKGRAGRRRNMRPWTVVVLSDYGRDRIAYQGYELLFNPRLDGRSLPVGNRYVLRMQAVYAFMDWVAGQLPADLPRGSIWEDFSAPPEELYPNPDSRPWLERLQGAVRKRQAHEAILIKEVLKNPVRRQLLEDHLEHALMITAEEVRTLLWEPPRPLMTGVLPTLLRRLLSSWQRFSLDQTRLVCEYLEPRKPLPEFVPASLFSELNLPEVAIILPSQGGDGGSEKTYLSIVQAINTFAPGRVTRRFGVQHAHLCHWVAPPTLGGGNQDLQVESFCPEYEEMGMVQYIDGGRLINARCVRPWVIKPGIPPVTVLSTSNAQLVWRSQLFPVDEGMDLELPHGSPWRDVIREIRCFTHNQRSGVCVRRFATESWVTLRFQRGQEREARVRLVGEPTGEPTCIGFTQEVDGITFRFRIPERFAIDSDDPNQAKVRSFRAAYFRHRVLQDAELDGMANVFQRDWLSQIYLSALVTRALVDDVSLQEAQAALDNGELAEETDHVLDVIFQSLTTDEIGESEGVSGGDQERTVHRQRVKERLRQLFRNPAVISVLNVHARTLWEAPDEDWKQWAAQRFKVTLGGALLQACLQLSPRFDVGDLYMDIDAGPRPPEGAPVPEGVEEIWITESTSGGGGVIEEILRKYADDPRHFFRLVDSVLEPNDFDLVDTELTRLLELVVEEPEVAAVLAAVRGVSDYAALRQAVAQLMQVLSNRGLVLSHSVLSAINSRVLRPGSSARSDALLHKVIRVWQTEEERLGVEIDARVFAYVFSVKLGTDTDFAQALGHIAGARTADRHWRFQVTYSLLWPRGNLVRSRSLLSYNPFATLPDPDREILLDTLQTVGGSVSLEDPEWRLKATDALARHGVVRLVADATNREALKQALLDLAVKPLDVGFLHLYPRVEGLKRTPYGFSATLDIREAVQ